MSPTSGERFPHAYGRIGQDAIVAVHPYVPGRWFATVA